MATKLVILESPNKIKTVKGYLGKNYKVIASQGHVRDLPKSTLGIDIENEFTPKYINIRGKGDLIKGNTIVADKLVIQGNDGLYYKLNTDGVTVEEDQTAYNSLNGSVILAKSITATKIDVKDLVAFDATIGGFKITDSSIHSGVKSGVNNTTRGIYLDKDGQMAIGDANNFIKYYRDANGDYKLSVSAESLTFSSSGKSVDSSIKEVKDQVDDMSIGGRNLFKGYDENEIRLNDYQSKGSFTQFKNCLTFNPCETVGEKYTISFWAKSPNGSTPLAIYNQNGLPRHFYFDVVQLTNSLGAEWTYFTHTITNRDLGEGYSDDSCNRLEIYASDQMGVLVKKIKIERGNKATDWTPAPEDMATNTEMSETRGVADESLSLSKNAQSLIAQLKDTISMLVTDGNGTSLMKQTSDGWTFSTADIQNRIDSTSNGLNELTEALGSTDAAVDNLKEAVDDLGLLGEYIHIGTRDGEPCIELGELDSDFKLVITNTKILFMDGSDIPAYINN